MRWLLLVLVCATIAAAQPLFLNATPASQHAELVELVIEMGKNIIIAIEAGERFKNIDVNIDRLFANDQQVKEVTALLFVQLANLTARVEALEHRLP